MLFSLIPRYSSLLILVRFLDKFPENLFFPNERILVSWEKLVEISPENSFEDKSVISRKLKELKSGSVARKFVVWQVQ